MPVSINNTQIVFNDSTTQSTSATFNSTDFGGVGSYALLINTANSNTPAGGTQAGSTLRINYSNNLGTPPAGGHYNATGNFYNGGGTAQSGTWRKMSQQLSYSVDVYGAGYYYTNLYVRIS